MEHCRHVNKVTDSFCLYRERYVACVEILMVMARMTSLPRVSW